MLTDYTTYDQVRAVLSVTDDELEDSTLALPVFLHNLEEQLLNLDAAMQSQYLTLLSASGAWTPTQKRFVNVLQVYSTYAVAVQLLDSLPLLAVKSEQDARAQYERFEKPFERVDAAVRSAFSVASRTLLSAYAGLGNTVTVPTFTRSFTRVLGLGFDPVTNV